MSCVESSTPTCATLDDVSQHTGHVWLDKEIVALLDVRLDMETDFNKCKNHMQLWRCIADKLNSMGLQVTVTQARDKFNALKKKWKEVVDHNNKSGNDRKDWKYMDHFDNVFGNRASAQPVVTLDSLDGNAQTNDQEKMSKAGRPGKRKGGKQMNERLCSVVEKMQERGESTQKEMQEMHREKMARMDRFLSIFEKLADKE